MPRTPLALPEFIERWKASELSERAAAQSHFIDLCEVLGQPHPAAADQSGDSFTFEKHVATVQDGKGFADVWKRGHFAWEYKGKHKDLHTAYLQLLNYREDLENPPLLAVCDQEHFEVHTNFTGTKKRVYIFWTGWTICSPPHLLQIVLCAAVPQDGKARGVERVGLVSFTHLLLASSGLPDTDCDLLLH